MADAVTERLDRILYLVARAVGRGGVPLSELASALGCEPADILRDLQEVTAREFYHPPGTTEKFQIFVEGDHVEVWTPDEFRRPPRLNEREALALGIGLRMLAAEATAERRARILELAARLENELVARPEVQTERYVVRQPSHAYAPDADALEEVVRQQPYRVSVDPGADEFRFDLADAAAERERIRIHYLKPGAEKPEWRDVSPYLLVHASGLWYVLGHDAGRSDIRVFRMDRILELQRTGQRFVMPADFDATAWLGDGPGLYRSPDSADLVTVRYGPRIARWIEERTPCERQSDGSVIVRHRVADPQWIVRHVLQYGADAEVIAPADVRDRVASAALRLSA